MSYPTVSTLPFASVNFCMNERLLAVREGNEREFDGVGVMDGFGVPQVLVAVKGRCANRVYAILRTFPLPLSALHHGHPPLSLQ
jgi:hypothetical protein